MKCDFCSEEIRQSQTVEVWEKKRYHVGCWYKMMKPVEAMARAVKSGNDPVAEWRKNP